MQQEKWCKPCGCNHPLSDFTCDNSTANGLATYCRAYQRKRHAAYRAKHRDKLRTHYLAKRAEDPECCRAKERERYAANREARAAYERERRRPHLKPKKPKKTAEEQSARRATYYEANRESVLAYQRQWRKDNPDKRHEYAMRRRAKLKGARVEVFTRVEIYNRDNGICRLCGLPLEKADLHIDHIIPLAKGGAHIRENVQATHSWCNLRKNTKLVDTEVEHGGVILGRRMGVVQ